MSRAMWRIPVLALALAGMAAGGASAQTAPSAAPADTPVIAAPAVAAAAAAVTGPVTAENLPDALKLLNLADVAVDTGRRGTRVRGTTADGVQIEAGVDPEGVLRGVRTRDDKTLPAALVEALLPQPVRAAGVVTEISRITGVGLMDGRVMVGGRDAGGQQIRAAFAEDGTLIRFGRGEEMRGPGRGDHGKAGKPGRAGDGRHGKKDGHHKHNAREGGDQHTGQQPGAGAGEMQGQAAPIDDAAATAALSAVGYTGLGPITRDGPRLTAPAINAAGAPVKVELNPMGQVVRETAR